MPAHKDARTRIEEMLSQREKMRRRLEESKATIKQSYDKGYIDKRFAIGDWILLRNKHIDSGRPYKKLDNRYIGPFQVAGKVGQ